MEAISIRYGEDVDLPLDTGDNSVSADIFIGKPGGMYILTKHITLADGKGTFSFSGAEMEIPLDTYYYQINTNDSLGKTEKYPSPQGDCDGCDSDFPTFIVNEALDQIEVS